MYVWMDEEFNQYEVEATNMVSTINYLEDGMVAEVVFYDGKAISCELPTTMVPEITWTEPAVKGDTSGKVLKPAKIPLQVSKWLCLCSWTKATRSKSTPAPANTASACNAAAAQALLPCDCIAHTKRLPSGSLLLPDSTKTIAAGAY